MDPRETRKAVLEWIAFQKSRGVSNAEILDGFERDRIRSQWFDEKNPTMAETSQ